MTGAKSIKEKTVATGASPTPKADAKKDLNDYPFLVKTLVTYTKMNAQGSEVKHKDEVVFKLDAASARMPWYVLRNYTVPKYLTKKYGPFEVAWQRIYEIKILKLINRADPADITEIPLRVMTISQLEAYVLKWELGVPVMDFFSVEKAREMVALRQSDEKGYEKHLAEYRDGKQRQYPELDNMRGDAEAAVAEGAEFEALDEKVPVVSRDKKAAPSAEASEVEKDLLKGTGPTGTTGAAATGATGGTGAKDPFAGV